MAANTGPVINYGQACTCQNSTFPGRLNPDCPQHSKDE